MDTKTLVREAADVIIHNEDFRSNHASEAAFGNYPEGNRRLHTIESDAVEVRGDWPR